MTTKDAKLELSKLGIVISKTEHGEFRVNFKGGSESSAYYTNDLGDAVGTGRLMGQQRQVQGSHLASRSSAYFPKSNLSEHIDAIAKKYKVTRERVEELMREHLNDVEAVEKDLALVNKANRPKAARLVSSADRFSASQALDRISDHIENLRREMPGEASNLRGLALRLDRVANTLEAEQEATERVSRIESELDTLGVDFTVAPNSSGKQATCIFAYKGQLGSSDEASVIGRIAKKHGSLFENMRNNRTYKITVPHHV
jgi:hypothetical protein